MTPSRIYRTPQWKGTSMARLVGRTRDGISEKDVNRVLAARGIDLRVHARSRPVRSPDRPRPPTGPGEPAVRTTPTSSRKRNDRA